MNDKALQSLRELVDVYVANRGTDGQFIICITPKGIPDYWKRAIKIVEEN